MWENCSIAITGVIDIEHPHINITVTSIAVIFCLGAIDCFGKCKEATFKFVLLQDALEEVRPTNVMQVVVDAIATCRSTRLLVYHEYKHVYWTCVCTQQ